MNRMSDLKTTPKAVCDRVIVRPDPETTTMGAFELPPALEDAPRSGTVVATGSDVKGPKTGDKVMHSQSAGVSINHDGERLLVLYEREVLAFFDQKQI